MAATATSARSTDTSWPCPVTCLTRSAARTPMAAWSPVRRSQAGSTWLTGGRSPPAPSTSGRPTSQLTV